MYSVTTALGNTLPFLFLVRPSGVRRLEGFVTILPNSHNVTAQLTLPEPRLIPAPTTCSMLLASRCYTTSRHLTASHLPSKPHPGASTLLPQTQACFLPYPRSIQSPPLSRQHRPQWRRQGRRNPYQAPSRVSVSLFLHHSFHITAYKCSFLGLTVSYSAYVRHLDRPYRSRRRSR